MATPDETIRELAETIAELKAELKQLRQQNDELRAGGPLNNQELRKAEDILVNKGKSLTHDEIRKLLKAEGLSEPVIEHVVSQVVTVLKKVKSGAVFSWDKTK
jgi:hypothetical protein